MKWFALACRVILAAVFIGASLPKIWQPHEFALAVFRYQMVPYALVNVLALILPWIELLAGMALLFSARLRDSANLLISGMLLVFTVAISFNLYRGIDIACGCFTVNAEASHMGALNVVRNLLLLAACGVVWVESFRKTRG